MFVPFLYELRRRRVPVGAQEAIALAQALDAGLHDSSMDGFYNVARSLLVHSEAHLDAFDEAFLAHYRGIVTESAELRDELLEWLQRAIEKRELTPEERELLQDYSPDELQRMFERLLREQTERHDGGGKWIGTGGTSPFGNSGEAKQGYRIGGKGQRGGAMKTADARAYRSYRRDLALDVRQMAMALRKLRAFAREGGEEELDLEATIDATARNAGELEVVTRPPRRPNTRVILMMDVGGSMDPYAHLVSRLFTAASKSTHFKELRCYYFHNCIYGHVYKTEGLRDRVRVRDVLAQCGRHYKLIVVGDGLMAPYELLQTSGAPDLGDDRGLEGIGWLKLLAEHYRRVAWLNPEPVRFWDGNTIEYIRRVLPMFPLTLEGLGEAVGHLTRGRTRRAS